MLRLGIKEFFRRIYTNIFTALQLAVVFLILLSIVSSVQSRIKLYMPVKDYLEGDGVYSIGLSINNNIVNENDMKKEYPEVESVLCSYTPNASFSSGYDDGKFISYTDEIINMYAPELKTGKWFSQYDLSGDTVYGIANYGSGIALNDTIKITSVTYDQKSDPTFTHPIEKNCNVKIIGILDEKAQVFGADTYLTENDDYRNLYCNYDDSSKPLLLLSQSQLSRNGIEYTINQNKQIIRYKNGLSDEQIKNINKKFNSIGYITLDKFKSASKLYVYEQIIKLLPLLICIVLLVIVSTVSISALNVKGGLRTYSIFYVCGSNRAQCLGVCLVNSILTAAMAVVISIVVMNIGSLSGLLVGTVIKTSIIGIFACAAAFIIQIVCSMIMPVSLMSKGTLNDNLSSNE